jgi:hypothetical protein
MENFVLGVVSGVLLMTLQGMVRLAWDSRAAFRVLVRKSKWLVVWSAIPMAMVFYLLHVKKHLEAALFLNTIAMLLTLSPIFGIYVLKWTDELRSAKEDEARRKPTKYEATHSRDESSSKGRRR